MKRLEPTGVLAGIVLGWGLAVVCGASLLYAHVIPFDSGEWVMVNAEVVEHMGRASLIGTAYLDGVRFENGIIEVDIAVDGRRTYAGVNFRIQSELEYEQFYVRPHRASLYPDALQYTPVFNGIACWQLYSGTGFTAGASLPENEWVHLRLEVSGTRARVYIGGDEKPALVIDNLTHGVTCGDIGLYGGRDGAAHFSNFAYRITDDLDFGPPRPVDFAPGLVTEWELSQAFQVSEIDLSLHPDLQDLPELVWQEVTAEPSGLVNVARFAGRTGRQADCVYARTTILSHEARIGEYLFGYSDYVSIFLNGEILFSGNSAYQKRDPSFLGIVGLNDAIYLPLNKGENELMFMVAESFGGWGFICQEADAIYECGGISKVWEVRGIFRTPEAVIYDRAAGVIYVSNYDAYSPSSGQGKQSISRVSPGGEVEDLEWATGLNNPTGMAVFDGKLFAVERAAILEIDTENGRTLKRHIIPEPGFLNDIAIDALGRIYVSDSRRDVIYRLVDGEFEEWLAGSGIDDPNGLHIAGGRLLVGNNGDTSLKAVDLSDKAVTTVARLAPGIIDGIRSDDDGNILVSHWEGRIYRISPSGQAEKILDTSVPGVYCADFEYVPERHLMVIPTFLNNGLVAYRMDK